MPLAGGPLWFTHAEVLERGREGRLIPAQEIPEPELSRLTAARLPVAGLDMGRPQVMGILNATPDSFSDGGLYNTLEAGLAAARAMAEHGATILDIGGESTRPGSGTVPDAEEIERVAPMIAAIRAEREIAISVDTRKRAVAEAAVEAGADLVNDVSGFTYDVGLAPYCGENDLPVCVMHTKGNPDTMQQDPQYDDVLLEVYDFLAEQIALLEAAGVARERIVTDPGIGFGKTVEHNLILLRNLSLFHALGCPILLGVSRKGFIGKLGGEPQADRRAPGSIAVGLAGLGQGVQILRVHDVAETMQALRLWQAVR